MRAGLAILSAAIGLQSLDISESPDARARVELL